MEPTATARLRVALSCALVEMVVQLAVLVADGSLRHAYLRVVFLLFKAPFCLLAWRRHAGGYLVVWVYEAAAVVAAVGSHGPALARLGFGAFALLTMVLLGRAVSAFPPVEWRAR